MLREKTREPSVSFAARYWGIIEWICFKNEGRRMLTDAIWNACALCHTD
jgi:hypothetical protein